MTDIEKMREALDRIPPMTGKVVARLLPQAEAQSEAQADAMVDTMMALWKKSMDEADRLRAEVRRLRVIEEAARVFDEAYFEPFDKIQALRAALRAKEEA
jgi:hypothetical protein